MALCKHFEPGPLPYDVVLVMDDHLGPTEALVRCTSCQRPLLLELLDWDGSLRLYRTAVPDEEATSLLLRDLERGSCDINRAAEEARQFTLSSVRQPTLLLIDNSGRTLEEIVELDSLEDIPTAGWRELPCDGRRITDLQAARL